MFIFSCPWGVGTWKWSQFVHWCLHVSVRDEWRQVSCIRKSNYGLRYDAFQLFNVIALLIHIPVHFTFAILIFFLLTRRNLPTALVHCGLFFSDHFSNLLKSFWTLTLFSDVLSVPFSFASPAHLLRTLFLLLLTSLMKNLNCMKTVPIHWIACLKVNHFLDVIFLFVCYLTNSASTPKQFHLTTFLCWLMKTSCKSEYVTI